ncbi:MAG: translation initiation factor IF-2 subunit beta [Thermoproteota archaeon]|nr:translation initiation factor IF-2 subunit beta [Thermoproteota archaeon]
MRTDYKELLKRAYSQVSPEAQEQERFEVPQVNSSIIGMRTIVQNFKKIADTLNRDPQHLLKFLAGELATATDFDGTRARFKGKFATRTIQQLIKRYVENFVICPVCGRPDTKIVKEKRFYFLVCEACGAKSSISAL